MLTVARSTQFGVSVIRSRSSRKFQRRWGLRTHALIHWPCRTKSQVKCILSLQILSDRPKSWWLWVVRYLRSINLRHHMRCLTNNTERFAWCPVKFRVSVGCVNRPNKTPLGYSCAVNYYICPSGSSIKIACLNETTYFHLLGFQHRTHISVEKSIINNTVNHKKPFCELEILSVFRGCRWYFKISEEASASWCFVVRSEVATGIINSQAAHSVEVDEENYCNLCEVLFESKIQSDSDKTQYKPPNMYT